jgi:hypothetical protein
VLLLINFTRPPIPARAGRGHTERYDDGTTLVVAVQDAVGTGRGTGCSRVWPDKAGDPELQDRADRSQRKYGRCDETEAN